MTLLSADFQIFTTCLENKKYFLQLIKKNTLLVAVDQTVEVGRLYNRCRYVGMDATYFWFRVQTVSIS